MTPRSTDLSARLARRLTLAAWRPPRSGRFVLGGVLLAIWLGSATWGAWMRLEAISPAPSLAGRLLDLAYAPFTYIAPQTSYALSHHLNWAEVVARFTGPLLPLLGLFWLVRRRLLDGIAHILGRYWALGHGLIVAGGGSGDALAIASSRSGMAVILVDPTVHDDEDRQALLGSAGVIAMTAVPPRPDRSGTVALWHSSDAESLAQAVAMRGLLERGQRDVLLALSTPDAHRALLQAPDLAFSDAVRLRPIAPVADALRRAWMGGAIPSLAVERGQQRVTLCLWGDGSSIAWAAELALRQFWASPLEAPHVLHWTRADGGPPTQGLDHFCRHAPSVYASGDLPIFAPWAGGDVPQASLHLVDLGDDDATLALAFSLAARLRQSEKTPAPVQAVLSAASGIDALFRTDSLAFLPPILSHACLDLAPLAARELDEAAARLHLEYDRQFGGGGTTPASGRWEDLSETYVAANRAAADHAAVKQWDARTSNLAGDELVEALARTEHDRWCAERLLAGWAPAPVRDNDRRLHPDLKPWRQLSEAAREKDRAQVRHIVGISGGRRQGVDAGT